VLQPDRSQVPEAFLANPARITDLVFASRKLSLLLSTHEYQIFLRRIRRLTITSTTRLHYHPDSCGECEDELIPIAVRQRELPKNWKGRDSNVFRNNVLAFAQTELFQSSDEGVETPLQ